MAFELTESSDAFVLPVAGWKVGRCCAEVGGLSVELIDADGQTARLNLSSFNFRCPEGDEQVIEAGDYRAANPLFERLGQPVGEVLMSKEGHLRITFPDGARLLAARMEGVEAWEGRGPGDIFVVAPTQDGQEPLVWGGIISEPPSS